MRDYLIEFKREMKNRNYARNTIRTYSAHIGHFLVFSRRSEYDPYKRISIFLEEVVSTPEQRRLAWSAIKLFYDIVLKKECPYKLDRVRGRKRLPDILTKDEVLEIINVISNEKHRLIITFLYASGLRVSEVVNLKIKDLNFSDLSLKIRNTKGHKDRFTLLSEKSVKEIRQLIEGRDGNEYIFLTLYRKKYTIRTVQMIFSNALKKTNLQKKPTCHTLRHCFATHLVESGTDIKSVKILLGHKFVKTTMVYVNLADPVSKRIRSPL